MGSMGHHTSLQGGQAEGHKLSTVLGGGALGQLHAGGLGYGKRKGMISIAESSFFRNFITVKLDFPTRLKTGAVKDVESFRKGHHTLRSSPRGVIKLCRVSGAVVVAIVLPSSL